MPRNIIKPELVGGCTVNGVTVIDASGNIDAPITTTNLTTTGNSILGNATTDTHLLTGATTVLSTSALSLAVGRLGATTPAFTVDSSTGSQVAGLKVTGATTGGTVAVVTTDSGADVSLSINAKGTGVIEIGSVSTGAVKITPKLQLGLNGGAASASRILMGVGTTANPAATAAAGNMFIEFRTKSTATSGDSRGLYWRHELAGAGVSGESLRSFTKVNAAVATARGAHISLDLADSTTVSGFGAGVDAQLLLGNTAFTSTLTALNCEIYAGGSSTSIGAGTSSVIRVAVSGDGTGVANILTNAAFLSFTNAASNVGLIDTDITALTGKAGLKVYVAGVLYGYIPIVTGS